jgi:hypothetical protein
MRGGATMSSEEDGGRPVVGSWYRDPLDRRFEVVAVDIESGVIEVCYQDGESAQMDLADWRHVMVDRDAMPEEPIAAPDEEER